MTMSNKKNTIMNILKEEILSLKLEPGTIISEAILSDRFELSRTPIREVLKQLSSEGYINIYPQRGSIVSYIDLESVEQVVYLRSILEKEIIKELCCNIPLKGIHELNTILIEQNICLKNKKLFNDFILTDNAFHKKMFELAGRNFLWDIIQQFNVHYVRYRKLHMLEKDKMNDIYNDHKQIVTFIMNKDFSLIEKLIHNHIRADINSLYFKEKYSKLIKN